MFAGEQRHRIRFVPPTSYVTDIFRFVFNFKYLKLFNINQNFLITINISH